MEKRERILIVEDEDQIREAITSMLTSAGYECRAVAHGPEALSILQSGDRYELLTTDLLNAPLVGLELLERVKEKFPHVEVIVVSAVNDPSVIQACLSKGAYDYLPMPFEGERIRQIVNRALDDRRKRLLLLEHSKTLGLTDDQRRILEQGKVLSYGDLTKEQRRIVGEGLADKYNAECEAKRKLMTRAQLEAEKDRIRSAVRDDWKEWGHSKVDERDPDRPKLRNWTLLLLAGAGLAWLFGTFKLQDFYWITALFGFGFLLSWLESVFRAVETRLKRTEHMLIAIHDELGKTRQKLADLDDRIDQRSR
ncbi:MAG TPA: response regulator [Terriglobales bacterium]|nr:response regulator [Terriglobales bacterium]